LTKPSGHDRNSFHVSVILLAMVHVGVLWMRFESPGQAEAAGERFSGCPKVHIWGRIGAEAFIVLKVPEGGRFWSDFIRDNSGASFGGVEAKLTYLDDVRVPPEIHIAPEKIEGDVSPCGSVCKDCPSLERCGGCPSLSLE